MDEDTSSKLFRLNKTGRSEAIEAGGDRGECVAVQNIQMNKNQLGGQIIFINKLSHTAI